MAYILEYRAPKFDGMLHGYSIYVDDYAQMCDEPLAEFWNKNQNRAKKAAKRAWRQHTPRVCKKRLKRLKRALAEGKHSLSWKKPGNLDWYEPPFISSFLPSFLRGGVR
jgi:hypothetical protein